MSIRAGFKPRVGGAAAGSLCAEVGQQHVWFQLDVVSQQSKRHEERQPVEAAKGQLKLEITAHNPPDDLCLMWQDTEGRKIEADLSDIAAALVVIGEIQYRQEVIRHADWLRDRKSALEEAERQRIENERLQAIERKRALEQARIDTLLLDADNLRRADTIRSYVDQVRDRVLPEAAAELAGEIETWAVWARGEADRIDPVLSRRYLNQVMEWKDDTYDTTHSDA